MFNNFTLLRGGNKLVRRMLAGEEDAFREFFDSYFPRLYRFALVRVDNDADAAEDVVQATLYKAIDKLETFRGEAALFSWLCTICRHEISAYCRKHRRGQDASLGEDSPEIRAALESLARACEDQMDAVRRKEIVHTVRVTLDHLSPKYSQVLQWKYIHGLSVKEIADKMDLGSKAVESLLTRAREAFKDGFTTMEQAPVGGAK